MARLSVRLALRTTRIPRSHPTFTPDVHTTSSARDWQEF